MNERKKERKHTQKIKQFKKIEERKKERNKQTKNR